MAHMSASSGSLFGVCRNICFICGDGKPPWLNKHRNDPAQNLSKRVPANSLNEPDALPNIFELIVYRGDITVSFLVCK